VASRDAVSGRSVLTRHQGQALVETALVLPLLLLLAFGVVGVGRVTRAQMGVSAVAREAARAGALAGDPGTALNQAQATGQSVATGYQLTNGSFQLNVDLGDFNLGGQVQADASYTVHFTDLPLLGWAQLTVSSAHAEWIDPFRSRWPSGSGS
jgi:Flp pilus assembly protein TadG